MNKMIMNIGRTLALGFVGVMCLTSCNEEPDGSNLFASDQKTIAELLREIGRAHV